MYQQALAQRMIIIDAKLDDELAKIVIAQLLHLEHGDRAAPVWLLVDAPGGTVAATMAVRDTLVGLACPVHVHCRGVAGGGAALIVASGARGHRSAEPQARLGWVAMTGSPGAVALAEGFAAATGQPVAAFAATRELTATDAVAFGLIDRIAPLSALI